MYKKMNNRVIEKEKGEFLLSKGIRFFLAINNETLCELEMNRVFIKKTLIQISFTMII